MTGGEILFQADNISKTFDGLKAVKNGRKSCEVSLVRRLLETQDLNKWGLKEEGNIGFKATKEV